MRASYIEVAKPVEEALQPILSGSFLVFVKWVLQVKGVLLDQRQVAEHHAQSSHIASAPCSLYDYTVLFQLQLVALEHVDLD